MEMNEYQSLARATAIYPSEYTIIYPTLGLAGEVGEVCGKIKKMLRDDGGVLSYERLQALLDELGDVLWYVAAIVGDLGCDLDTIAQRNVEKLESRRQRDKLRGDGDKR